MTLRGGLVKRGGRHGAAGAVVARPRWPRLIKRAIAPPPRAAAAIAGLHSAGHPASGTASSRACDSRDFRNSTLTCIKIPPTIAVLRFAATILQYKYLKSALGATKKYGSK